MSISATFLKQVHSSTPQTLWGIFHVVRPKYSLRCVCVHVSLCLSLSLQEQSINAFPVCKYIKELNLFLKKLGWKNALTEKHARCSKEARNASVSWAYCFPLQAAHTQSGGLPQGSWNHVQCLPLSISGSMAESGSVFITRSSDLPDTFSHGTAEHLFGMNLKRNLLYNCCMLCNT